MESELVRARAPSPETCQQPREEHWQGSPALCSKGTALAIPRSAGVCTVQICRWVRVRVPVRVFEFGVCFERAPASAYVRPKTLRRAHIVCFTSDWYISGTCSGNVSTHALIESQRQDGDEQGRRSAMNVYTTRLVSRIVRTSPVCIVDRRSSGGRWFFRR